MNIFKKKTEKHTTKLPMTGKVKKGFRIYCTAIMGAALVLGTSVTAFAAGDPITVINNLSTFIFGLIRAIGLILLGFGVVQVGLSLKSHDPSQPAFRSKFPVRFQGFVRPSCRSRKAPPFHRVKGCSRFFGNTPRCEIS